MFPLELLAQYPYATEVLQLLPFQYLAYFPAMVFLEKKVGMDLVIGLLIELGWAVGLILLCRWLYRLGLRHYSAYGG
jgi:ABC-2 type transport system permease protein